MSDKPFIEEFHELTGVNIGTQYQHILSLNRLYNALDKVFDGEVEIKNKTDSAVINHLQKIFGVDNKELITEENTFLRLCFECIPKQRRGDNNVYYASDSARRMANQYFSDKVSVNNGDIAKRRGDKFMEKKDKFTALRLVIFLANQRYTTDYMKYVLKYKGLRFGKIPERVREDMKDFIKCMIKREVSLTDEFKQLKIF